MKNWYDAETVGARLRWAVENYQRPEGKRRGIGLLIQKLETHGVKGATYPSIGSYFKDAPTAPIDFLLAAAKALNIDEAWLILGRGSPANTGAKTAETTVDALLQSPAFHQAISRVVGRYTINALEAALDAAKQDGA